MVDAMSRPTQNAVDRCMLTSRQAIYELHREIDKLDQEKEILEGEVSARRADLAALEHRYRLLDVAYGVAVKLLRIISQAAHNRGLGVPLAEIDSFLDTEMLTPNGTTGKENARIEILEATLKVAHQALLEVNHAQEVGPSWYTNTESGLRTQVAMWVRNGLDAIHAARPLGDW